MDSTQFIEFPDEYLNMNNQERLKTKLGCIIYRNRRKLSYKKSKNVSTRHFPIIVF